MPPTRPQALANNIHVLYFGVNALPITPARKMLPFYTPACHSYDPSLESMKYLLKLAMFIFIYLIDGVIELSRSCQNLVNEQTTYISKVI